MMVIIRHEYKRGIKGEYLKVHWRKCVWKLGKRGEEYSRKGELVQSILHPSMESLK
jgi:hypothetical protein